MGSTSTFCKALTSEDMVRMMLPRRYWDCTFDGITAFEGPDRTSPQEIARRYLSRLNTMLAEGVGLLLWGDHGIGKTGIAAVIAKWARRRGYKVLFLECSEMKRFAIDKEMFDDESTVWQRACDVDLLVLDDFGKGLADSRDYGKFIFDRMIRHRNAANKATFITTNMDPRGGISAHLKIASIAALRECIIPCRVDGPDRRETTKHELASLFVADA